MITKINNISDNLVLASLKFEHRDDWTLRTRTINALFSSIAWYPVINHANIEVVQVKWLERSVTVHDYFNKLSRRGLIYDVPVIKRVTDNVYVVGFIGPYRGTVRERIINSGIPYYRSSIQYGRQNWLLIAPMGNLERLRESLRDIGRVVEFRTQVITSINDALSIMILGNPIIDYVKLALTVNELSTLRNAWKLGYFNTSNRLTLNDVADALGKDKSTVDRQLKGAIRKLVNYIVTLMTI